MSVEFVEFVPVECGCVRVDVDVLYAITECVVLCRDSCLEYGVSFVTFFGFVEFIVLVGFFFVSEFVEVVLCELESFLVLRLSFCR